MPIKNLERDRDSIETIALWRFPGSGTPVFLEIRAKADERSAGNLR
jgi:hypothetical protein